MSRAYHEDKIHGTSVFPLQVYSHHDKDGFYFVSQHWHEELHEIKSVGESLHHAVVFNPGFFRLFIV